MAEQLTEEQFQTKVMGASEPVLVDFFATWCGPCKMIAPVIEQVAEERTDITVCKVNVDEAPRLAEQFSVMSIPTLVVYKNGVKTAQAVGGKSAEEILALVNRE